jgi:acyl-coenzyme A thioesterase PaaI-like protein
VIGVLRRKLVALREGRGVPHGIYWHIFNVWPALVGTGGRVTHVSDDWTELDVRLPLTWRTRNYVGTIFGGSIYSATDPYAMLMLMRQLGDNYVVWDKGAKIAFKRPATETLYAEFRLPRDLVEDLRARVDEHNKLDWVYVLDLKDKDGNTYATIEKQLYLARKDWYVARQERRGRDWKPSS